MGAAAHPPLSNEVHAEARIKIKSSRSDSKPDADHENTTRIPKIRNLW
jgi:hypothetical protein